MTPDEQEARSRRYAHGVWALTLSSGRIAAFPHPMQNELVIADTLEEAAAQLRAMRPQPQPRIPQTILGIDIGDL